MNDHPVIARIRLNLQSRDVQRDLRDPAQMHRTVMRMVPDNLGDAPRHQAGLLYRLDVTDISSTLLVQAAGLDPSRLPAGYGQADVKSLAPMFTALRKGLGVRYRIVLNPAKRQRLSLEEKGKRGKIVPLSGAEADQWWLRRAAEAGLDLHVLTPTTMEPVRARGQDTPRMRHSLIRYDGTAVITDPDALRDAITGGIGRGKPYGAGLLSLAPARST
ncbi:type I-E CRISPR-associated protein Cas6/Cse3/CasE [Streptomyces griseosporeus]|uniref:type I-E CRISPR-associated protein Cas6/Cse3/CasE n=1 Tax=Streptomyces griseosporeus TaxID=1910 RepID=UPI0037A3C489